LFEFKRVTESRQIILPYVKLIIGVPTDE